MHDGILDEFFIARRSIREAEGRLSATTYTWCQSSAVPSHVDVNIKAHMLYSWLLRTPSLMLQVRVHDSMRYSREFFIQEFIMAFNGNEAIILNRDT